MLTLLASCWLNEQAPRFLFPQWLSIAFWGTRWHLEPRQTTSVDPVVRLKFIFKCKTCACVRTVFSHQWVIAVGMKPVRCTWTLLILFLSHRSTSAGHPLSQAGGNCMDAPAITISSQVLHTRVHTRYWYLHQYHAQTTLVHFPLSLWRLFSDWLACVHACMCEYLGQIKSSCQISDNKQWRSAAVDEVNEQNDLNVSFNSSGEEKNSDRWDAAVEMEK